MQDRKMRVHRGPMIGSMSSLWIGSQDCAPAGKTAGDSSAAFIGGLESELREGFPAQPYAANSHC